MDKKSLQALNSFLKSLDIIELHDVIDDELIQKRNIAVNEMTEKGSFFSKEMILDKFRNLGFTIPNKSNIEEKNENKKDTPKLDESKKEIENTTNIFLSDKNNPFLKMKFEKKE